MAKAKKSVEAEEIPVAPIEVTGESQPVIEAKADGEMMTIRCIYPITINNDTYHGDVTVPRHIAEMLIEMLSKKRQADLNVFVGNSFLVERIAGSNKLVVKKEG